MYNVEIVAGALVIAEARWLRKPVARVQFPYAPPEIFMHQKSYDQMARIVGQYLAADREITRRELEILDVGSLDINGSYRKLFDSNPKWHYVGADAQGGSNVDVVLDWDYKWTEIQDESFDVVISGQTLEHVEAPWLAAKAMERVCRKDGLYVVIVPSRCDYHPYPLDCWRIFPDGMRYLMTKISSFSEIECQMFEYELDGVRVADTVFVGRKK